ncbi:MAG: hypothetical protein ABSH42_14160 [Bryobacteraceae bacterium]|jgi:hypothetical protein
MRTLPVLLFLLAQPFWEAKPPEKWSDAEIDAVRHSSPWVQTVGPAPNLLVWLATAQPVEEAEAEARLRTRHTEKEPDPDYAAYLTENRDNSFVLAVAYPTLKDLGHAEEDRRMEQDCQMIVGRKSYPIIGHFPPTPSDPVLRLVFPRVVKPADKAVTFRLYLAGLSFPERELEFRVKDLLYHGKLAM